MHKAVIARMNVSSGGTPTFVEEVLRDSADLTSGVGDTNVFTLTSGVTKNNRIMVAMAWQAASPVSITSVADSQGNTYAAHQNLNFNTSENIAIWSANAATALTGSTDTITITWDGDTNGPLGVIVSEGSGISTTGQPDGGTTGTGGSTSPTASASTTSAKTLCIGIVKYYDTSITYGSSAWTISGSQFVIYSSNNKAYLFYSEESSSGAKDPLGTLSSSDTWGVAWASFD